MNWKRIAIVGTAQSWSMVPWADHSLSVLSLNDAYRMPGFQRADAWFDFHPVDKWHISDQPVYPHQVPAGHYARPTGHIEWIANQTIPVYLHPDYRTQHPDAASWGHVRPFPKAKIEAHFGRYFTSSPAWMMALAIMEGCRDISVYGIHLSTEFEYVKQRPNFEFLMGCLLGSGKRTLTVKDECRIYESSQGRLVLPEASPVLQENFQYAFDPKPDAHLAPMQWELHKLGVKRGRIQQALMHGWSPLARIIEPVEGKDVPMLKRRSVLREELIRLDALSQDWQEQIGRASAPAGVS